MYAIAEVVFLILMALAAIGKVILAIVGIKDPAGKQASKDFKKGVADHICDNFTEKVTGMFKKK